MFCFRDNLVWLADSPHAVQSVEAWRRGELGAGWTSGVSHVRESAKEHAHGAKGVNTLSGALCRRLMTFSGSVPTRYRWAPDS